MWQLLSADNDGRTLAFLDDFDSFSITPRLNGYAEIALTMPTLDKASQGVAIGRTAIKAYQDGALRFFGKVWEPLDRGPRDTSIVARGPFAEFGWRRAQSAAAYTAINNAGGPWDAAQILADRVAIQNGRRNTYLRIANPTQIALAQSLFETDVAGWTSNTATITFDPAVSHEGGGSGRFTSPGVTPNEYVTYATPVLTAGQTYTGSIWVKGPAGAEMYATLYLSGGTQVDFVCTGAWQLVSSTFTATVTGAATFYLATRIGGAAQRITAWVDEFRVEPGPVRTAGSTTRIRSYEPGQREDEIAAELVGASGGFFFREDPLDNVPNLMAELRILYPYAGSSREEVRFEYGENTIDNLLDFKQTEMLPLNGMTVSGASDIGGRIAQRAEDAASIASYGLFEDETGYTDVGDTALLAQQAQARINPNPPVTLALTPGIDSPKLFTDFNIGDFVRVRILWGGIDLYTWARVLEATLEATKEGVETLSAITVEIVMGDQINTAPEILWRSQLDDDRRRLEALERRVQGLDVTTLTPPAPPAPDTGTGDPTPTDPTPPPAPPPPAPSTPPSITGLSAAGIWLIGDTNPKGTFHADVDGHGQPTTVYFEVVGRGNTGSIGVGTGGGADAEFGGLARNTGYTVIVHASNASGETTASTTFTTPNVQIG